MLDAALRTRALPDRILVARGHRVMRPARRPAIVDRLVPIVIVHPGHHERVLHPDQRMPPDLDLAERNRERQPHRTVRRGHVPTRALPRHHQEVAERRPQQLRQCRNRQVVVGNLVLRPERASLRRRLACDTGAAGYLDAIRWICPDHIGQPARQHLLHVREDRGVAAEQPVLAHDPYVARHRGGHLRRRRSCVVVGKTGLLLFRIDQRRVQFVVAEADDIQVEAVALERLQFDAQHLLVPPRVERQLVVGQH